jgi:REP element-mobilizing transposase RayT
MLSSLQDDRAPTILLIDMDDSPHRYRRSLRLPRYDYSQAGAYFVTVCVSFRHCVLGSITNDAVQLSEPGKQVAATWSELPDRFPTIELDAWVVMPNHLHGIILLPDQQENPALGAIVRAFKAVSTHRVRSSGASRFRWQPNYYEHIVRTETELERIRRYIVENPMKWALDQENPDRAQDL